MNKKQQLELEVLQQRWKFNSKSAKADPVLYALQRSRREYLKVVGNEVGLQKWQAGVLKRYDLAGFKLREEERARAVSILKRFFREVTDDNIMKVLVELMAEDIYGIIPAPDLPEEEQKPIIQTKTNVKSRNKTKVSTSAIIAGLVLASSTAPMSQPAFAYNSDWESIKSNSQFLVVESSPVPDATRGMGIYIPKMVYPVGSSAPISSGFGYRDAPCPTCSTYHEGIDFNPGYGSPVYSATDGVITWVGYEGSLGYHVIIQDAGTWHLYYGHMINGSAPAGLTVGSKVQMGQQIGLVGNTGLSTGAHLHFGIQDGETFVDPLPLLQKYAK